MCGGRLNWRVVMVIAEKPLRADIEGALVCLGRRDGHVCRTDSTAIINVCINLVYSSYLNSLPRLLLLTISCVIEGSPINRTRFGTHRHYTGVWLLPVHIWYPIFSSLLASTLPIHLLSRTRGYLMSGCLRSGVHVKYCAGDEVGLTYALGDEYTNQQTDHEEDNDEDDNDTRLTLSEVTIALGQLRKGELAASGNEVRDGGHCAGYRVLQQR